VKLPYKFMSAFEPAAAANPGCSNPSACAADGMWLAGLALFDTLPALITPSSFCGPPCVLVVEELLAVVDPELPRLESVWLIEMS
jgi:hypothetical protein